MDAYLYVYRIDKGYGNACAIKLPDGTVGIVDWGTRNTQTLDMLLNECAGNRIRFIAATHSHTDHTEGLEQLMLESINRGIGIDCLVYPSSNMPSLKADPLTKARIVAHNYNIPMHPIALSPDPIPAGPLKPKTIAFEDRSISVGGEVLQERVWEVCVLAPPENVVASDEVTSHIKGVKTGKPVKTGNVTSLVLLFHFTGDVGHNGRVVFPGDATEETLNCARSHVANYPQLTLQNDAIVIPHHGSTGNLPDWIHTYIRNYSIISAPTNRPGNPSQTVLEKLSSTCQNGNTSKLLCTSYAHQCRQHYYDSQASTHLSATNGEGPCFEHIKLKMSKADIAVEGTTEPGDALRPFGFCGNVP